MIPLRDVIPTRTTPVVTIVLIVLCAVVFLFELMAGNEAGRVIMSYGVIPVAFAWTAVATSMFVHAGVVHVAGNVLCLWLFGSTVEDRMGHLRFLIFFLLCGVVAVLTQTALNRGSLAPIVGASGATAGVMGAYFVLYPGSRILTLVPLVVSVSFVEIPAFFFLGVWFLLPFIGGLWLTGPWTPGSAVSAFWAHVAGFLAGAGSASLFWRPERRRVEWWHDLR